MSDRTKSRSSRRRRSRPRRRDRVARRRFVVFVMFDATDLRSAQLVRRALEGLRIRVVVLEPGTRPGSKFVERMDLAIVKADCAVLILSKAAMKSDYVREEWTSVLANKKKILPIRIEEFTPKGLIGSRDYLDLVGKSDLEARQLIRRAIKNEARASRKPRAAKRPQAKVIPIEKQATRAHSWRPSRLAIAVGFAVLVALLVVHQRLWSSTSAPTQVVQRDGKGCPASKNDEEPSLRLDDLQPDLNLKPLLPAPFMVQPRLVQTTFGPVNELVSFLKTLGSGFQSALEDLLEDEAGPRDAEGSELRPFEVPDPKIEPSPAKVLYRTADRERRARIELPPAPAARELSYKELRAMRTRIAAATSLWAREQRSSRARAKLDLKVRVSSTNQIVDLHIGAPDLTSAQRRLLEHSIRARLKGVKLDPSDGRERVAAATLVVD